MHARDYYDEFSRWYERERGHGYHQLLDDLEIDLVAKYGTDKDVLEAGCGTGLLLARIATFARSARGVDLSAGMLSGARQRGLHVVQGSLDALPFADASFDVVCSFKVLAHVLAIEQALCELARVTRPGGTLLLEFYNRWSIRYLTKRLFPARRVSERTKDDAVFTRYDAPRDIARYLPRNVEIVGERGIRVVTPTAHVHRVPGVGRKMAQIERALADLPLVRRFGGFLVVIAKKR